MKRALKWIGIAVLTPILLFLILAALLYFPPVQNWAVQKVAAIASEKTGMDISVGYVRLEWPLNLGIDNFRALHPNDSLPNVTDTIADARHLTIDVQLRPLFEKRVVINQLALQEAKVNTNGFISDLRIKGDVGELWLRSNGIDLDKETVEVNGARLTDARLDIALSDTAAVDTTESTLKWVINADSLSFRQTDLTLHLPGDTVAMKTQLGQAVAREARIDLGTGIYQVGSLDGTGCSFNYAPIGLSDMTLGIDQFSYAPTGTSLYIRKAALKDKSTGLEITDLKGSVRFDADFSNVQIPALYVKTPDSDIFTEVDMDLNTFGDENPGKMKMRLNAQIGKQDMIKLMGDMPQGFIRQYPNQPLSIKGSVNGNMRQMDFTGLDINLPTAFHATASGTAGNLTDLKNLKADIRLSAKTQDLGFAASLLPSKDYRIPNGITLDGTIKADGTKYAADLTASEGGGSVKLKGNATIPLNAKGNMAPDYMTYDADIKIQNLNLHHFMPKDSLYNLSADIKAKGHGTDFLSNSSHLTADATVNQLHYGHWDLSGLTATANLQNGHAQATLTGHNDLFDGTVGIDALLNTNRLEGTISADLDKADLYEMRLMDKPLTIGLCGHVDISSDLKESHTITGLLGELYIANEKHIYRPDDLGLHIKTDRDTTYARIQSGDLIVKLDASEGYETILRQISVLSDSVMAQFDQKIIDQPAIKRLLPTMKLHIESQRDNPLANFLKASNITFKELFVDLNTSPITGINGESHLYSLVYDSTRIDTFRLNLTQKGERLTYQGQVRNNKRNPQFVFNALFDGHLHEHGVLVGLRYYDAKDKMGIRLGATAEMEAEGIRFKLMPERPTIGYKEFNLNKDNFIFLARPENKNSGLGRIQAKIDLVSDDKTGLKIYTENQDSTMLQDLTVSIHHLDLGELTSVLPYMPRITGYLQGDYHILQDRDEHISVASDMAVQNMTFEGSPIGNISTELVYLMKEDDTHAIEARLMLDDEEFGLLNGTYKGDGHIDALFTMTRFPLSVANGFVPDQLVGLEGFGEGELTIKGTTTHPQVDGEIYVEDAYLVSQPYGVRMRFDNDPIRVVGSHLLLENFGLYAYNDEPLVMMGDVDFSNTDHITTNLQMRARNLLLINSKQEDKSIAFGKAYVNFFARLQGPVEEMKMRGRLDVLGSTDMTYMLLDSPLSTDNRLEELVKFTDFSDTTQVVITRPTPTGFEADLTINISQGAHIICNLNIDQTNYIDLMGGGELRMKYNSQGIDLRGRYTLSNGEMKYSLSFIPLKTFTIKDGSFVEFTGDPMNPRLNITATERTKATVSTEGGTTRSVAFDCGVIITNTLNNMGLEFIIDAPEDQTIGGELTTMSKEERGKVAITMLTTGMYLADGNTSSFSMNSALSSFLQSEINNIAGSAFKTLDLSVGIDNSTDASGSMHTDYSFKFAKRMWNNRLKIQIGGKVSSGSDANMGQRQSFFDNVTMEYRLNQDATKNLKLFYFQNVYDWLEGYTGEYGGGFVWRRKLDNFWDIFRFWKKEEQRTIPMRQSTMQMPRDSVETDSLKVRK